VVVVKIHHRFVPGLAGQLAEELLLVHAVLECFPPVDEHHWDLVIKLPPQFTIAIDIDFLPGKSATAGKLGEALFHQLAKMASLSRVNHDLPGFWHGGIVAPPLLPLARKKKRADEHEGPAPASGVKSEDARSPI
jgi:hypothetical protein